MQLKASIANFLRAFRFPVYELSGTCRFGGGNLNILYAGGPLFLAYLESVAYGNPGQTEFLGKFTLFELNTLILKRRIDLSVVRSHLLLARAGLFPDRLYVPEWIAGVAYLSEQSQYERTSTSRQRDRKLIKKHDIDYVVTTATDDLNYFYDHMYVPHIKAAHSDSALLMTREKMMEKTNEGTGELVSIRMGGTPVAGSFVIYDRGQPRLQSGGVLNRDVSLMRKGVGTAIYLLSFDYLAGKGFDKVHLGMSRAFLSDGVLYFKKRFGLQLAEPTRTGYHFGVSSNSTAVKKLFENTGYIHITPRDIRAALFSDSDDTTKRRQRALAEEIGIKHIDIIDIEAGKNPSHYRISKVNVAQTDS